MLRSHSLITMAPITLAAALAGCSLSTEPYGHPGERVERLGDEIVVCGQLFHTGAPVVLWMDPGGYDAYRVECKFDPEATLPSRPAGQATPNRYSSMRRHLSEAMQTKVQREGWRLEDLQEHVDLFVLHYDVCGTSRKCFEVLHDRRGLSVHFLLDLDGTIYQTLDLKERAWHAGSANDRSVGVEIANMGAYSNTSVLDEWYVQDDGGRTRIELPATRGDGGIRTPGFEARPARDELVHGQIQGRQLMQYDFTDEQYESLIKLTATLCDVLPRIEPDYPRDPNGALRTSLLSDEEMADFSGILGHYHISPNKVDPGPAMDWDRLIGSVRRELSR